MFDITSLNTFDYRLAHCIFQDIRLRSLLSRMLLWLQFLTADVEDVLAPSTDDGTNVKSFFDWKFTMTTYNLQIYKLCQDISGKTWL